MRKLLVHADKKFVITIPDDAELTFGPWSPPNSKERTYGEEAKRGTLRVYTHKKADVLAVFSGVVSFRDMSVGYAEEIAKEEGATIWKDDEKGYYRESKVKQQREWVTPVLPADPDRPDTSASADWKDDDLIESESGMPF